MNKVEEKITQNLTIIYLTFNKPICKKIIFNLKIIIIRVFFQLTSIFYLFTTLLDLPVSIFEVHVHAKRLSSNNEQISDPEDLKTCISSVKMKIQNRKFVH